jgi:hypothetical protein
MSISQKQAVVNAVQTVLGAKYTNGTAVKTIITKDELNEVRQLVFEGIKANTISLNKTYTDDTLLRRYVNGMVDNHLRKAKELNGGSSYSPSAKRGSSKKAPKDPQLDTLKKLAKSMKSDNPEFTKVQAAITARETELSIAHASAKKSPVLDEELQAIVDEF